MIEGPEPHDPVKGLDDLAKSSGRPVPRKPSGPADFDWLGQTGKKPPKAVKSIKCKVCDVGVLKQRTTGPSRSLHFFTALVCAAFTALLGFVYGAFSSLYFIVPALIVSLLIFRRKRILKCTNCGASVPCD